MNRAARASAGVAKSWEARKRLREAYENGKLREHLAGAREAIAATSTGEVGDDAEEEEDPRFDKGQCLLLDMELEGKKNYGLCIWVVLSSFICLVVEWVGRVAYWVVPEKYSRAKPGGGEWTEQTLKGHSEWLVEADVAEGVAAFDARYEE